MSGKENTEFIYLDQDGYNKLLSDIDKLKNKLAIVSKAKGEVCSDAVGDGWHDNFAYDEACEQERLLAGQLAELYMQLKKVKIIEKTDDDKLIEIGDVISIDMIYQNGDIEEMQLKLVGSFGINFGAEIKEISVESPIGKAIYHKCVGEEAIYSVNGNYFNLKIKAKLRAEEIKVKKKEM